MEPDGLPEVEVRRVVPRDLADLLVEGVLLRLVELDPRLFEESIDLVIEVGHSRIPIFHDSIDEIVGILYAKDLLPYLKPDAGPRPALRKLLRPPVLVPESMTVDDLLHEFQRRKVHIAVVLDEYGGTAGLVTIEDLLEEIVGEIADEYDVDEPRVEHLPGGALRVPGRTAIDDVNEELGIELPADEWDTVGGLVFNLLGKVPAEGETVRFQGFEFQTERVQGQRIVSVQIRPVPGGDGSPERSPEPAREAPAS